MIRIIVLLSLLFMASMAQDHCVVTMGYKPKPKEPYIFADDSGIYRDVYGEAFSRIGCTLKIIRLPKLRMIQKMKNGTIDFYPAFQFTKERAAYASFVPSKINHKHVLVTRTDYSEITDVKQLLARKPTLLKEIGGYSALEGIPAKRFETTDISIQKTMELLLKHRIDAFNSIQVIIEYYLKKHDDEASKIRLSKHFFKNEKIHTLGFSRASPYFTEKNNDAFDPRIPISEKNSPTVADENSVVYRFAKALEQMEDEGFIRHIYDRYRKRVE